MRFMTLPEPQTFARAWVDAWNAHDVEAVLSHFAQDVVFTSPVAAQLFDDCDGVLRGKSALRAYWTRGLQLIPDLRFEVVGVYAGISTIVIHYRNHKGGLVCEVLRFEGAWWSRGTARTSMPARTTTWPARPGRGSPRTYMVPPGGWTVRRRSFNEN